MSQSETSNSIQGPSQRNWEESLLAWELNQLALGVDAIPIEGIKMRSIKRNLTIIMSASALVVLFQNCEGAGFDAAGDRQTASSGRNSNPLITDSTSDDQGNSGGGDTSGSASSSGNDSGDPGSSSGSDESSSAGDEPAYDCNEALSFLGWNNANTTLRLTFAAGAVQSYFTSDYTNFLRDRFIVAIEGPVRPYAPADEAVSQRVFASQSDISFRLVSLTGGSAVSIPAALMKNNASVGTKEELLLQATNTLSSKRTRLTTQIDRSVFEATRSLGVVELQIYCKGQLVNKAVQDLRVLDFDMDSRYVKSSRGDTYITVNGNQYRVARELPAHLAPEVKLSCPLNIAAGGTGQCSSSAIGASLLQWFVNLDQLEGADNLSSVTAQNAQVGRHLIQTKVEYADGRKARSAIQVIEVK